ncbi:hypothetical protein EU98_1420 [Prochlorococcus marinus str. MIT 9314]|uniref:Uncharacterized protein n=1 Tax=Prochlorococcus marinus str. MIT 9314 TaxID=167548 RepID=A0A0A2AJL5_PROMR|nr:hypothetical protein EU98_1420 [Prochlorococcus marinus str. MIT 9314]
MPISLENLNLLKITIRILFINNISIFCQALEILSFSYE